MKLLNNFLTLGMLCIALNAGAQDYAFTPVDLTVEKGTQAKLVISMTNNDLSIISAQFDLILPDGVTTVPNSKNTPTCSMVSTRSDDHLVQAAVQPDGSVRYLTYSPSNTPYIGSDGPLVTTLIEVNLEPGEYTITIRDGSLTHEGDYVEYFAPVVTGTLTVTAPEEVRYGDNQLYVKDITINEGEDAVMEVYYNSASDLHEYSTAIKLPAGVTIGEVTYCDVLTSVNYNTESTFDNGVLTLSGEQSGTAKKPKPSEAGNHLFAQVALLTDQLAAGEYDIAVGAQYLSNEDEENDGEYNPDSYTARLIVVGASALLEQCAMPEISVDEEGNLIVTCETDGTTMHTTINAVDHGIIHHANEEIIPLTGQYIITSYASAENMKDSSPATAMLVWTKRANTTTGVNEILAGTERALLIRSMGENVEITGTVAGEDVSLFNLSGTLLYYGKSSDNHTVIPVTLNNGEIYIIKVGAHAIKYLF